MAFLLICFLFNFFLNYLINYEFKYGNFINSYYFAAICPPFVYPVVSLFQLAKLLIALSVVYLAALTAEAALSRMSQPANSRKSFGSQFLDQTLSRRGGRGRKPVTPKQCEASGHAEIVKPEDFITPNWTEE